MQMELEEPNIHVSFKVLSNLVLFFSFVPLGRFVSL